MSQIVWGITMMTVGLFFFICAWRESQFPIYRLFVGKAKLLWGDNAHKFLQVSGAIIIIVGGAMVLGLFQ